MFEETFASTQADCTSNGDFDNLFISSGTTRLRSRMNTCVSPLPSIPNVYDSNEIFNQFAPETPSQPDITIPEAQTERDKDIEYLKKMFNLSDFNFDTTLPIITPVENEDICSWYLVRDSKISVCEMRHETNDVGMVSPPEHVFTVYGVRLCMSSKSWHLSGLKEYPSY